MPIDPATGDMSNIPMSTWLSAVTRHHCLVGFVDYAGNIDPNAPHLYSLFGNQRTPVFTAAYRVYRWDRTCNCRSGPITNGL